MQTEGSRKPAAVSSTEPNESRAQSSIPFLQIERNAFAVHDTQTYRENIITGTF